MMPNTKIYVAKQDEDKTKSEIQDEIIAIKSGQDSDLYLEDRAAYFEQVEGLIEMLEKQYETAPEEYIPQESSLELIDGESSPRADGETLLSKFKYLDVEADLGKASKARLYIETAEDGYNSCIYFTNLEGHFLDNQIVSQDLSSFNGALTIEKEDAAKHIQAFLKGLDMENYSITSTAYVGITDPSHEENDYIAHAFYIAPAYNGVVGNYACFNMKAEMDVLSEDNSLEYNNFWPQEELYVIVDHTGIISVSWKFIGFPEEMINENVELKDFESLKSQFENQAKFLMNVTTNEEGMEVFEVCITDIKLGYARIMDQNNKGSYLLVPVWDFYGYSKRHFTEEGAREFNDGEQESSFEMFSQSFLTLNAVDGSIINRVTGY